jgi:uncharacterized protein YjiS (DUF1127 family)
MRAIHLATIVAAFASTSLASRLLAIRLLGPSAAGSDLAARSRRIASRLKSFVDGRIAAMLAHRERQAAMFSLRRMSDRELKDIGLHRGLVDEVGRRPGMEARHGGGGRPTSADVAREARR